MAVFLFLFALLMLAPLALATLRQGSPLALLFRIVARIIR